MKIITGSVAIVVGFGLAATLFVLQRNKDAEGSRKAGAGDPSSADGEVKALVRSNHRLASGLYSLLSSAEPGENLLIAPGSTLATLTTLLIGAEGEQAAELKKSLELELTGEALERVLTERVRRLKDDVNKPDRFFLGLQIESGEKGAVRIKSVQRGTSAERAGFQPGERIVSVRLSDAPGHVREIRSAADFVNAIDEAPTVVRVRCLSAQEGASTIRTLYLPGHKGRPASSAPPRWETPVKAAAALWFQDGVEPAKALQDFARKTQALETSKIDLQTDVAPTAKRIRLWFNDFTERKVSIPAGTLSKNYRAVHSESFVFKPYWSSSVQSWAEQPMSFALPSGKKLQVTAVPLTGSLRVSKSEAYQGVELPCTGGLALMLFLPAEGKGLAEIEKLLSDAAVWPKLLGSGVPQPTTVMVPELDLYSLRNLRGTLAKLGMPAHFTIPVPSPEKEEKVKTPEEKQTKPKEVVKQKPSASTVMQQVQVQVRSNTDLELNAKSAPTAQVNFNRPFVFVAFDRQSKEILVLGRCVDPRSQD